MYYIDQSGKIEQTDKQTVLSCVNDEVSAVILSAKDKRRLQEYFRKQGQPRLFIVAVFTICLYYLLKSKKNCTVKIDKEYEGQTEVIFKILNNLLKNKNISVVWANLGKNSKAHDIAYKIFKEKITLGEKLETEKVNYLAKKIAGGYLNSGLSPENRYSAPADKNNISSRKLKVKNKKRKKC